MENNMAKENIIFLMVQLDQEFGKRAKESNG